MRIYFDESDESMDGLGWNVVSIGEAIAARFETREEAETFAALAELPVRKVRRLTLATR